MRTALRAAFGAANLIRTLAGWVLITAMIGALALLMIVAVDTHRADAAGLSSRAVQVEPHTSRTAHPYIIEARLLWGGRLYYRMNNGAAFRTGPCAEEDSPNCWWNAGRGNGKGRSFVSLRGRAYYGFPT